MNPRIFLHIGANKTGTTALQSLLGRHDDQLRQLGILYPKTGRECPSERNYSHIGVARALGFSRPAKSSSDGETLLASLLKEIAQSGCSDVIISAEYFILRRDVKRVSEFLKYFDTSIVVYLRRHDSWLEALIMQALKTVPHPSWEICVEGYIRHQNAVGGQHTDYNELLTEWSDAFGRENLIVRPFEKQQNQPSLIADFLTSIGREDVLSVVRDHDEILNKSPPADALMLMRRVRAATLPEGVKNLLTRLIENGSFGSPRVSIFSPETRRDLVRCLEPQYAQIAGDYLGRTDGRLFYDPVCTEEAPFANLAMPSVLQSAGYLFKGMFRS